ncbi:MAG TPA: efflux RND transporter periplasmic adaptor subunit [Polyangiales bacterium]|nr:efflux RND transporter periplasmic adaptor subunit [Polyangiales bacterium]
MTPDSAMPNAPVESKPPAKHRGTWITLIVLALIAAGGFVVWKRNHEPQGADSGGGPGSSAAGPGGAAKRPTPVLVGEATVSDVPVVLEGLGTVTPIASVVVRSRVDGQLESVKFVEGANVKRGEVLAQIDPRAFQVQVQQAQATLERDRATLENSQRDLDRYMQLGKLVTQQQIDTQRSQVATLNASIKLDEAAIANAKLQLDYARITAPISGVAGIRTVNPGNLVHASDTSGIVTLTQLDPIAVVFTLPQDVLPKVSKALSIGNPQVDVFDRAGTTSLGTGKLTVLDNQVNADTGTLRLKAELPNPNRALWPNQFVKSRVAIEVKKNVLSVPAAAIARGPSGDFVYVVTSDNKAEQRSVKVESIEGERALLVSGLNAGDRVIVDGQDQVKPGGLVVARGANGAGAIPAGPRSKGDAAAGGQPSAAGPRGQGQRKGAP